MKERLIEDHDEQAFYTNQSAETTQHHNYSPEKIYNLAFLLFLLFMGFLTFRGMDMYDFENGKRLQQCYRHCLHSLAVQTVVH